MKENFLLNVFITSQLSHGPVVWMFHKRKLDNHINRIHERTLRIVYQDIIQLSKNFMQKTLHYRITESPYLLQKELRFKSRNIRSVRYGIETAAFVGSRTWSYMPTELKESMSQNEFRSKIKAWK